MNRAECESRDCLAFCEPGNHHYCDELTAGACPFNCGEEPT